MPVRPPPLSPLMVVRAPALLALLFIPACGDPEPADGDLPWSMDNEEPAWVTPQDGWRLDDAPVVVVGPPEEPEENVEVDALFRVRGGGLFADGSFVLAERGGNRILLYANDGARLQELGGEGSGPGEFRELMFVATNTSPQEIAAWDPALQRATIYRLAPHESVEGPEGEQLSGSPAEAPPPSWEAHVIPGPLPGSDGLPVPVAFPDPDHLLVYLGPPEVSETGKEMLGLAVYRVSADRGRYERSADLWRTEAKVCQESAESRACTPAPFTTFQALAGRGTRVVASHPQFFAFHSYDLESPDVQRSPVHGRSLSGRYVTDQAIDSLARQRAGSGATPTQVAEAAREVRAMDPPPRIQGIDALIVDSEGMTWARQFGGDTWFLFTPDGRWLGNLELPAGFTLLDASGDRVLGVRRGPMGVERAEVWRLCRDDCWPEASDPPPAP